MAHTDMREGGIIVYRLWDNIKKEYVTDEISKVEAIKELKLALLESISEIINTRIRKQIQNASVCGRDRGYYPKKNFGFITDATAPLIS